MGSVIIAVPNQDRSEKMLGILRRHGFTAEATAPVGAEVLRAIGSMDSGIVICQRRFKDMSYLELFEYLPEHFNMLLITDNDDNYKPRDGLIRLLTPFKSSDLLNTAEMMIANIDAVIKRKRKPVRSLEEKMKIDKAKHLLMERNDMTEPEAFRYIQKTSMDTGRSMVESAEMILMLDWER